MWDLCLTSEKLCAQSVVRSLSDVTITPMIATDEERFSSKSAVLLSDLLKKLQVAKRDNRRLGMAGYCELQSKDSLISRKKVDCISP